LITAKPNLLFSDELDRINRFVGRRRQEHMISIHRTALRHLFPFLLCLLPFLFNSCSLFGGQKDNQKGLLDAADRFNKSVRWEDYKSAANWIGPSAKEEFWDQVDRLQGRIRVIDYQVVDAIMEDRGGSGTVVLRYRFFPKNNPQPQIRTLHQQWIFSKEAGGWQILRDDLQKLMLE
jgi:hypothetical protein